MKRIVSVLIILIFSSLSFSQFNGITGAGQGVNISLYNNITANFASLYPIADTVTTITIVQDVSTAGYDVGVNTSSPILFWTVNLPAVPEIGGGLWNSVAGTVTTGSVDGSVNDRLEFNITVGTGVGEVPPGTDIMYYISAVDETGGSDTRYAFATTSTFPTTLPALAPSDLWKLRANNEVTYNTKRMDALFFDWQPNERIDTLANSTNGETSELRSSWNETYVFLYVDKLTNWDSTQELHIYLNTDADTNNGGREGVTTGGLAPTLPFNYDYVVLIRPIIGVAFTDIRTFANRNVNGSFAVPFSFNHENDILELEIERAAIGAPDTNTTIQMFLYIKNETNGDIVTSWPSTGQDLTDTTDGDINFNEGTPRWYSYRLAPGQVPGLVENILPVELTSFTATTLDNKVKLNWSTATEINNYGFEIQRSTNKAAWDKVGFVEGNGMSNSPKFYSFTDQSVKFNSTYQYRLKQIDNDGAYEYSDIVEVLVGAFPNGFVLNQNYPNPFNPSTVIKFGFANNTKAELRIYDILGNEVSELFNGQADAGRIYDIQFNASNFASGVYYYKLTGDNRTEIKKMIFLK